MAAFLICAGCQPKQAADDAASTARDTNSSSMVNKVANTASNAIDAAGNAASAAGDKAAALVSANTNTDNTGVNVRDRNGATLTPDDQGRSPADVAVTQQIRKAVTMGTNDFSVIASNVKIITVDGKVTLRGPVNTESEKDGTRNQALSQVTDVLRKKKKRTTNNKKVVKKE